MGYWAEVRNDFFESGNEINSEIDGDVLARISIDAWKTNDENEDGCVIACVMLSKHGDVLVDYRDSLARYDDAAQEAIKDAKDRLKEYFQEQQKKFPVKAEEAAEQVYCLCEEFEDDDAIRQFSILAVSTDKDALRGLMEAKIVQDKYGFVKDKGVGTHDTDHFSTEFDCGFVEYYILNQKVLSRDDLERMVKSQVFSKHISEVVKGDQILFDDCIYTATSDAYMTKTGNGREWNFEVEGEGPEEYLYASYFEGGVVTVARQYRENALDKKIQDAQGIALNNAGNLSKNIEVERD